VLTLPVDASQPSSHKSREGHDSFVPSKWGRVLSPFHLLDGHEYKPRPDGPDVPSSPFVCRARMLRPLFLSPVFGGRFCGGGREEREDAAAAIPGVHNRRGRCGKGRGPRVVWGRARRRKSFPNGGREARNLFIAMRRTGKAREATAFHRRDLRPASSELFVAIRAEARCRARKEFCPARLFRRPA